jgi:hypothetical protein
MNRPLKTSLPMNSKIEPLAFGSYFHDAWEVQAAIPELDPLEQFIRVLKATPNWIDTMMVMRNRIVELFGLNNLGTLSNIDPSKPSSEYKLGERVGIFTLIEKNEHEVLLGDEDKHLNVVVSVHKKIDTHVGKTIVTVSTVVHVKNWFGRIYMIPVVPAHHVIAQRMTQVVGNPA